MELVKLDVRSDESVAAAVADVHARMGQIDIAINNAGLHLIAPAELCSIRDCQAILDTNVLGALRIMQAVLPEMRRRRAGRIVIVTSAGSFVAVPHMAMYTASKHALDALSAAIANEVKPFGIVITTVAPGTFHTAMAQKGLLPRETYDYSPYAAASAPSTSRTSRRAQTPSP